MKKLVVWVVMLLALSACNVASSDVPQFKGYVNDYADILSKDQISALEKKLQAFERSSTNQVALLIMKSLDDKDLESFTLEVARTWKLGQKGKDNGVLIAFFIDDKKDRIEVGTGLEPILTDAMAGWILDNDVEPLMKQQKYPEGIIMSVDRVIQVLDGSFNYREMANQLQERREFLNLLLFIAILSLLSGIFGYIRWYVSGISGAIGLPLAFQFITGISTTWALICIPIGFVGGLLAYFILSVFLGGGVFRGNMSFGEGVLFGMLGGGGSSGGGGGGFSGGGASGGW